MNIVCINSKLFCRVIVKTEVNGRRQNNDEIRERKFNKCRFITYLVPVVEKVEIEERVRANNLHFAGRMYDVCSDDNCFWITIFTCIHMSGRLDNAGFRRPAEMARMAAVATVRNADGEDSRTLLHPGSTRS